MKALKIEANKGGKRYAIVAHPAGGFAVYAECSNYAGHVRGGIAKTWRVCEKGIELEAAEALFTRKLKGKSK